MKSRRIVICYMDIVFYEDGKAALEDIKQRAAKGESFHIIIMDIYATRKKGFLLLFEKLEYLNSHSHLAQWL